MFIQIGLLILSIAGLYFGAEFALDAAEKIGRSFKLSPLVIGLLLIGFGTSLPEFFVSQLACFRGDTGLALGNIVGSNIANLFLILGVSGLFATLTICGSMKKQLVFHLILTLVLIALLETVGIGLIMSAVFGTFFVIYLYLTFKEMKNVEKDEEEDQDFVDYRLTPLVFIKLLIGFGLLYGAGELLVSSGSKLGAMWGVSTYVISAVFVAFGTSFPELVTAILACVRKKDTDLITGNIIGSNIFNIAFVLGSLGVYDVPKASGFIDEYICLIGASLFLLLLAFLKKSFSTKSAILFLGTYSFMIYYWIS